MSEALEALERMTGIPASVGVCEPVEGFVERPQDAADSMREMAAEITRLRAAMEQGEAVEYWVLFDASGGRKFIKKEVGSGVLAFFDDEFAAKAAKRANPGTDYQKVVYYKAPPSTAEVKAQATELALWLVMDEWEANLDDWTAEGIKDTLLSEAKRLREEG